MKKDDFENYLASKNLSDNTQNTYIDAINHYRCRYDLNNITQQDLSNYKIYLIENYKPQTVNVRLRALNCYLEMINKKNLKIQSVKIQNKTFLENVISEADYEYLKEKLKTHNKFWYFVVRFMAATGVRISELLKIKVEHIKIGYLDLYSKGGKIRRIFIPQKLQVEAAEWLSEIGVKSGFLFTNSRGNVFTPRGIASQLKVFAKQFGIDTKVVYPHSFRHRFAKNFLAKYNDISLLADLMGHESIETTRIYLRKTSSEQRAIVDEIIDW